MTGKAAGAPAHADRPRVIDPAAIDAKTANVLYHDWEASQYDGKWGITFDERVRDYAVDKFRKVAPRARYGRALEIGSGTGFFLVNLAAAGLVREPVATDISARMCEVARRNAEACGVRNLRTQVADAESLPFADETFDLVVGHAVLHHLPDVPAALREAYRVLKPGGSLVIAGEPTRLGYFVVLRARRGTARLFKAVDRLLPGPGLGRPAGGNGAGAPESALEAHVDLHEFHPHMVRGWLREAGFDPVRVETEEFVSALWGWSMRTIEALARPELLTSWWPWFAYHSYIRLYRLDDALTRRIVPKALGYNLLLAADKPRTGGATG